MWRVTCVFALLLLVITACGTFGQSPEEKVFLVRAAQIPVVPSLPEGELERQDELGTVSCRYDAGMSTALSICRRDIKVQAAKLGAEVIVLDTQTIRPCAEESPYKCLFMEGRAFRKKLPSPTVATAATPLPTARPLPTASPVPYAPQAL